MASRHFCVHGAFLAPLCHKRSPSPRIANSSKLSKVHTRQGHPALRASGSPSTYPHQVRSSIAWLTKKADKLDRQLRIGPNRRGCDTQGVCVRRGESVQTFVARMENAGIAIPLQ